jgi:hypothetical protein
MLPPGVPNVLINGAPALGAGDKFFCIGAPPAEAVTGSPNVKFGAGPTETRSKTGGAAAFSGEDPSNGKLTVKDFADILKKMEAQNGYEAARDYAINDIDYMKICGLAKSFVNGNDPDKDNDPNIMPARFMLLYGADDGELRKQGNIDDHPDRFSDGTKHKISVDNLRKALRLLGYNDIGESGPLDDGVYHALLKHLRRYRPARPEGTGDKLFEERCAEKGADPKNYKPGVSYRYPWVPFSVEVKPGGDYQNKSAAYEIFDRKTGELLAGGNFSCPSERIEVLLPDSEDVALFVDEIEMDVRPS